MSTSELTITGLVATTPRHIVTQDGLPITSFRVAEQSPILNHGTNALEDNTNWFTVTSFKTLAVNVSGSINKGDRIIVTGKLRIRDWDNGERAGTSVEIEATAVGHDLSWGTSTFTRTLLTRESDTPVVHKTYEY